MKTAEKAAVLQAVRIVIEEREAKAAQQRDTLLVKFGAALEGRAKAHIARRERVLLDRIGELELRLRALEDRP